MAWRGLIQSADAAGNAAGASEQRSGRGGDEGADGWGRLSADTSARAASGTAGLDRGEDKAGRNGRGVGCARKG